jgi:hypothetical protein
MNRKTKRSADDDVIFISSRSRIRDDVATQKNEMIKTTTTTTTVTEAAKMEETEMYDPDRDEENDSWIESRLSKVTKTRINTEQQWRYKNDEGKIFGPFTSKQMNVWVRGGYFPSSLMVSSSASSSFVPLSSLKNPFAKRKKKIVISCPCCFVPLSYQASLLSREKTIYVTSETINCRVNTNERLESNTTTTISLHPLLCLSCGTEVGTCDIEKKEFTFLQCIPGY